MMSLEQPQQENIGVLKKACELLGVKTPLELSNLYTREDQKLMKSNSWDYANQDLVTNKIKNILEQVSESGLTDEEKEWRREILWFWYHHAISCAIWRYQDKEAAKLYASKALEYQPTDHPNKISRLLYFLVNDQPEQAEEWLKTIRDESEKITGLKLLEEYRGHQFFDKISEKPIKQESPSKPDHTPFHESLQKPLQTNTSRKIKALRSNPNKLVKEIDLINLVNQGNLNKTLKNLKQGKSILAKLESQGMKIAKTDFFIGNNKDGNSRVFAVVDRINGNNISRESELPMEISDELDRTYSVISNHFLTAYLRGGFFMWDFNNSQFVYGNKPGDVEKHIYLVDTEPWFETYDPKTEHYNKRIAQNTTLFTHISLLWDFIQESETKFGENFKLQNARTSLKKLVDQIKTTEPLYDDFISIIKDDLG